MPDKYPDLKNMCDRCQKRKSCKKLCQVANGYVSQDGQVYEQQDDSQIKVFPLWNEVQASTAPSNDADSKEGQASYLETNFIDDKDNNPFSHFQPEHLITKIFMLRFFDKWSYEDLAIKFDLKNRDATKSIYFRAVHRLREGLAVIDEHTKTKQNAITSLKNSPTARQLNPSQKDYLLYAVFGLDHETISEITGRKFSTIRSAIHQVKKKLDSGEYSFEDLVAPGQWDVKAKANAKKGLKSVINDPMINNPQRFYLLHFVFGLEISDIAQMVGKSYGIVYSGIYRTIEMLKGKGYTFDDLAIPGQWQRKAKENSLEHLNIGRPAVA